MSKQFVAEKHAAVRNARLLVSSAVDNLEELADRLVGSNMGEKTVKPEPGASLASFLAEEPENLEDLARRINRVVHRLRGYLL